MLKIKIRYKYIVKISLWIRKYVKKIGKTVNFKIVHCVFLAMLHDINTAMAQHA